MDIFKKKIVDFSFSRSHYLDHYLLLFPGFSIETENNSTLSRVAIYIIHCLYYLFNQTNNYILYEPFLTASHLSLSLTVHNNALDTTIFSTKAHGMASIFFYKNATFCKGCRLTV